MTTPGADALVARVAQQLRAAGSVWAEDEARVLIDAASGGSALDALVARRVGGEPLEQVVGYAEFDGLRIAVAPSVFVPRRRSLLLVRVADSMLADGETVVDMCCGAGALGAALTRRRGGLRVHAVDIDPVAVACARSNLASPDAAIYVGDLFAPLPHHLAGLVDLIVANAPYVPSGRLATMPAEARRFEPSASLDGGPDGVDVHRRIAAAAPHWLRPGGHLAVETSRAQQPASATALLDAGLVDVRAYRDDELEATVVVGAAPANGV